LSSELQEPWTFENPLCSQVGGDTFYAGDEDDPDCLQPTTGYTQDAKKVCGNCEHIVECAEWGIRHEKYGVWGGLSPYELTLVRKKRNINVETVTFIKML
jgi:hypothetical protein